MSLDYPRIPAFNHCFEEPLPFVEIKAEIKVGENRTWKEVFKVSSLTKAEEEIKQVVDFFNITKKPGQSKREFIKLVLV